MNASEIGIRTSISKYLLAVDDAELCRSVQLHYGRARIIDYPWNIENKIFITATIIIIIIIITITKPVIICKAFN